MLRNFEERGRLSRPQLRRALPLEHPSAGEAGDPAEGGADHPDKAHANAKRAGRAREQGQQGGLAEDVEEHGADRDAGHVRAEGAGRQLPDPAVRLPVQPEGGVEHHVRDLRNRTPQPRGRPARMA